MSAASDVSITVLSTPVARDAAPLRLLPLEPERYEHEVCFLFPVPEDLLAFPESAEGDEEEDEEDRIDEARLKAALPMKVEVACGGARARFDITAEDFVEDNAVVNGDFQDMHVRGKATAGSPLRVDLWPGHKWPLVLEVSVDLRAPRRTTALQRTMHSAAIRVALPPPYVPPPRQAEEQ